MASKNNYYNKNSAIKNSSTSLKRKDSESDDENPPISTDWYICRMCHKNFPGKRQLWLHKRAIHSTQPQPQSQLQLESKSKSTSSFSKYSSHSAAFCKNTSTSNFIPISSTLPAPNKIPNLTTFTVTTKTTTKTTNKSTITLSTLTSTSTTIDVVDIQGNDDDDEDEHEKEVKYSHKKDEIKKEIPIQENPVSKSGWTEKVKEEQDSKVPTTGAPPLLTPPIISDHSQLSIDDKERKVHSNVSVIQWSSARNLQPPNLSKIYPSDECPEAKRRKIEFICLSSDSENENENEEELEKIEGQVSSMKDNQNQSQSQSQCQSSIDEQESNLSRDESQEFDHEKEQEQERMPKLPIGTAAVSPIPVPKPYLPSLWLSETKPQRFPYFPQMGDDLVYLRQGHELYVSHMENIESDPAKFYVFDKWMKKALPYVQHPELPAEISVRVVGIKFEILPPRLVQLKLARTNWMTGAISEDYFNIKYHDVDSVVDFLVLRQIYDKSLTQYWKVGQKFRSILEKKWWLGTIIDIRPISHHFPNSNFLQYFVEWDIGNERECLSPWDMEKIPEDFVLENPEDGIPATEKELRNQLYEVGRGEWEPSGDQNVECARISKVIQKLIDENSPQVAPFAFPVDAEKYPDYRITIPYPIDLSTIKTRLDNRFYRRIDAVETDLEELVKNTRSFNGPDAEIVQWAKNLKDYLFSHFKKSKLRKVQRRYRSIESESNLPKSSK